MRHATLSLALIGILGLLAGTIAAGDTITMRVDHQNADVIAGSLPEVMARVAPQLGIAEADLAGLSALSVPGPNEVIISGPKAAIELAQKVVRALDVPRQQFWLASQVIRTDNPADILRLPENATTVRIDGKPVTVPDEVLGMPPAIPGNLPTLVCVPNPNLAAIEEPGHKMVGRPRVVTMAGHEGRVGVRGEVPGQTEFVGHEVGFVPSPLPDGSISVVLTLYHHRWDLEQPEEIELAYVARDGEPWAFALLPPEGEERPTTVFIVTVSSEEIK